MENQLPFVDAPVLQQAVQVNGILLIRNGFNEREGERERREKKIILLTAKNLGDGHCLKNKKKAKKTNHKEGKSKELFIERVQCWPSYLFSSSLFFLIQALEAHADLLESSPYWYEV